MAYRLATPSGLREAELAVELSASRVGRFPAFRGNRPSEERGDSGTGRGPQAFLDWLDVASGSRALDLGVGRGAVASRLEVKDAWVTKVDLSTEMLKFNAGPRARMDAEHHPR